MDGPGGASDAAERPITAPDEPDGDPDPADEPQTKVEATAAAEVMPSFWPVTRGAAEDGGEDGRMRLPPLDGP